MVCYKPMLARRSIVEKTRNGKCVVKFVRSDYRDIWIKGKLAGLSDDDLFELPCGQCIGCRLERSRQWAVRIMHEADCWDRNCFITLTYDDDHLPSDNSLDVTEFQKFMKRFRKACGSLRFYHCGEYGDQFARPHYHACIFNYDFADKQLWRVRDGIRLYTSELLSELWPLGFSTVGELTFDSAAYVARYCTKKVTGDLADEHYAGRKPEYATMSRRPGIGRHWFDQFKGVTYRDDSVVLNGHEMKPPRYYDTVFQLEQPELFDSIRASRVERGARRAYDSTTHRLGVREFIKKRQFKQLIRSYDGV